MKTATWRPDRGTAYALSSSSGGWKMEPVARIKIKCVQSSGYLNLMTLRIRNMLPHVYWAEPIHIYQCASPDPSCAMGCMILVAEPACRRIPHNAWQHHTRLALPAETGWHLNL